VLFSGLKLLRNGGNASFLHKMVTGARDAVVRHLEANTTSENLQVGASHTAARRVLADDGIHG
jgi:hypothetical protein